MWTPSPTGAGRGARDTYEVTCLEPAADQVVRHHRHERLALVLRQNDVQHRGTRVEARSDQVTQLSQVGSAREIYAAGDEAAPFTTPR